MIFQPHGIWKQVVIALLMCEKGDFKPELVRGNQEGHYILIKGTIH
jgi:hypothetical protein